MVVIVIFFILLNLLFCTMKFQFQFVKSVLKLPSLEYDLYTMVGTEVTMKFQLQFVNF
jgi:hypothetical protein